MLYISLTEQWLGSALWRKRFKCFHSRTPACENNPMKHIVDAMDSNAEAVKNICGKVDENFESISDSIVELGKTMAKSAPV